MKRKNNFCLFLITVISFFFLTGCVDNNDLEIWIVEKEMPLYESHIDDNQNMISTLQMGDTCVPEKRETEKVFQYTEVLCLKSGLIGFWEHI